MRPLLILLLLLALAVSGCSSATSPPVGQVHTSTTLQWGIANASDVPTLDPALASDPVSMAVSSLVYGGLVRLDDHLRVQPDGASRWSIGAHGTLYTFHLRSGLAFADGRAVTAADIVTSLQRALSPTEAAGPAPVYLGLIARSKHGPAITAIGKHTVQIRLIRPAAHFLSELAFPISFVPDPRLSARFGEAWTDHASGFGPYRVASWVHTWSLTLVANPHYWGGTPAFRRIEINFYGTDSDAIAAYKHGAEDVVSGFAPGSSVPTTTRGLRSVPGLALDYLAFNVNRAPFDRQDARLALAAMARKTQPASDLRGSAFAARNVLASSFGVKQPAWSAPQSPNKLLAAAGSPGGQHFHPVVLVVPQDPGMIALGHALVNVWKSNLHIAARVQTLNPSNYSTVLTNRTFQAAIVRWGADYPDPQDFLGTQLGTTPYNITGWSTPAYQHLVSLADSYDPADPRRAGLFQQAIALVQASAPLAPLDEPAISILVRPSLHGVTVTGLGSVHIDVQHAKYVAS